MVDYYQRKESFASDLYAAPQWPRLGVGRAAAIGAIAVIKTIRLRPLPGEAFVNYIRTLRVRCGRGHPRSDYMPMPMPPMPPPPMPPMPSPFSSGSSAIMASVVSISPAIEAAFCRA